jgi:hypothetical protein
MGGTDDLLECEVAADLREFVIAAAKFVNEKDGVAYRVSSVMGAEDIKDGKELKLVMVSCIRHTLLPFPCGVG